MATGLIFSNARVRLTTTTCYYFGSCTTNGLGTTGEVGSSCVNTCNWYDITPFTQSVRLTFDSETRDNTVMGASFRKEMTALRSAAVEVRCLQQYSRVAESVETCTTTTGRSIDGLMYDLYNAISPFFISVRPDNVARSSCNPEYIVPVTLGSHTPLDGAVADMLTTTLRFTSQGAPVREVCATG